MSNKTIIPAVIAISEINQKAILVSATYPDLLSNSDLLDGDDLDDIISETDSIPVKAGVYKCNIVFEGFSSNTPDGTEYDAATSIENAELISIPLGEKLFCDCLTSLSCTKEENGMGVVQDYCWHCKRVRTSQS